MSNRMGMGDILKQVQKLQEDINQAQESLAGLRAEGAAGGGMVTAIANGKQELLQVRIDKTAVDPEDLELLEDLVVVAVNQALGAAREMASNQMSKVAGGVLGNLSGGMKIPGL